MQKKLWLAALIIGLVACGKDSTPKTRQQLQKEYGDKLTARLDKLAAASLAGRVGMSSLGTPGDQQLALDFTVLGEKPKPNAMAVHTGDIEDPKAAATYTDVVFAEDMYNQVKNAKYVLGVEPSMSHAREDHVKQVLDVKYVLVVYPTEYRAPRAGLSDFTPGLARGTAVLVEIETGKPLGGFEFAASNDEEVFVKVRQSDGASDAEDKVKKDLWANTGKAISEGIAKRWPGAKAPYNYGHGW